MAGTLHVNLADPRVQRMLGDRGADLATGNPTRTPRREIVQIVGDAPDPTGLTSWRGAQSTTRLNAGKEEVLVLYGDLIMTVDIYRVPDEPVLAHIFCPRCHKLSTIRGDQKVIAFDPGAVNPVLQDIRRMGSLSPEILSVMAVGRLSIEAFECTWEVGDDRHAVGGVHTGASLCRLRIAIDDNRAKEA